MKEIHWIEFFFTLRILKKETEKKENTYFVKLFYDESDETEMVIRLLSFGPMIKVIEPLEIQTTHKTKIKETKSIFHLKRAIIRPLVISIK